MFLDLYNLLSCLQTVVLGYSHLGDIALDAFYTVMTCGYHFGPHRFQAICNPDDFPVCCLQGGSFVHTWSWAELVVTLGASRQN